MGPGHRCDGYRHRVKSGVATLTGFVRSYMHKWQAESDAKRIAGVSAVANDIQVRLPTGTERPDPEIARDAVAALHGELPYSSQNMKVVINDGFITLEGSAEWNYQRKRAEEAVRRVKGITGVVNLITVKPRVTPSEIRSKIEEAFRRNAEIDANRITVETNGGEVKITGSVRLVRASGWRGFRQPLRARGGSSDRAAFGSYATRRNALIRFASICRPGDSHWNLPTVAGVELSRAVALASADRR
jgi:osmotically-inducible protein OsmY